MTPARNRPTRAILVAHGQPSAPEPAEKALQQLAGYVQEHLPECEVVSATLAMPGRLETVCDTPGGPAVIYPCLMSKGFFTSRVLPQRLGDRDLPVLSPMGLDPALPGLVAKYLETRAAAAGYSLSETGLLLAAHGSARGNRSAEATRTFATALAALIPLREIRLCFVEQSPFVAETAADFAAPSLCLPFFALEGDHVRDDIRSTLQDLDYSGAFLPVIGELPGIGQLIATAIRQQTQDL